jgi:hypothetical protein
MLERRRRNKQHYDAVPGGEEDLDGLEGGGERDVELGEGFGAAGQQETGRIEGEAAVASSPAAQAGEGAKRTVTEELDNWDENVEDEWEEADADADEAAAGKSAKRAE